MPTLVIPHPSRGSVDHPVTADTISIGRTSDNTIQIRDDSVSSRHMRLTRKDGHYHLENLSSTNGCYVDDRKVEKFELVAPCTIRLGSVLCRFLLEDPLEDPFPSFQKPMVSADSTRADRLRKEAEKALESAQRQSAKHKEDHEKARKEAAVLLEKLAAAEKRIETMTRETRTLRESSEQQSREIEKQRTKINALTENCDAAKKLEADTRLKLDNATGQLTTIRSEFESLGKEMTDLENRTGHQATHIESLTAQRDDLQRSNDQLSAKLAESRQRVDSITRQHEKASKELVESQAELEGLLDGAETVMSWFERISKRAPSAIRNEASLKPLPPRIEKPIRAPESIASEEMDERRVTRKIEPPVQAQPKPPSSVSPLPTRIGQTQRIELPRAAVATDHQNLAPLITNISSHLTRFKANRSDLSPLRDVLRDGYNLTRSAAKIGSSPLFNLASAFEAMIRDIQHMPTRITDDSMKTLDEAIALMKTMLRDDQFTRTKNLPDGRILAIGADDEVRRSVIAAMNSVNLQADWVDAFSADNQSEAPGSLDLVLLDESARGTNGNDPCTLLRKTPTNAKTPILLLSRPENGNSPDGGFSDRIAMPFSHRELAVKALTWRLKAQLHLL